MSIMYTASYNSQLHRERRIESSLKLPLLLHFQQRYLSLCPAVVVSLTKQRQLPKFVNNFSKQATNLLLSSVGSVASVGNVLSLLLQRLRPVQPVQIFAICCASCLFSSLAKNAGDKSFCCYCCCCCCTQDLQPAVAAAVTRQQLVKPLRLTFEDPSMRLENIYRVLNLWLFTWPTGVGQLWAKCIHESCTPS